jgi:structure-specific endonuclease subunit SLX1
VIGGPGNGAEGGGVGGKPWYCYMLQRADGRRTYVGATVDPDRRLRQHNGELVGGARATRGGVWRRIFLIGGFTDERDALRFEWRWKYLTRELGVGDSWMERRAFALGQLLAEREGSAVRVLEEPATL